MPLWKLKSQLLCWLKLDDLSSVIPLMIGSEKRAVCEAIT